jgi:hypothetical protein
LLREGWRGDQQETDDDASHAYAGSRACANFNRARKVLRLRKGQSLGSTASHQPKIQPMTIAEASCTFTLGTS